MTQMVVNLGVVDRSHVAQVGGKGAQLGELTRIDHITVPAGFCVTTEAFARVLSQIPGLSERLATLDGLDSAGPGGLEVVRRLSAEVRTLIEQVRIPDDITTRIRGALGRLDDQTAYAVRSSATAEDLPTASFAGQHDSLLEVTGEDAVLGAIRRCWASLFTERAVIYRRQHDIGHRAVRMAVVVQQMVPADAAGVMFTADPTTGHRAVTVIEAVVGLGEALVSGQVKPDSYTVRGSAVEAKAGQRPVLTGPQVQELVAAGRRIEAHFGQPQDIEWCLADGEVSIVQSRPITTLFPLPEVGDDGFHVYVSVGHQQMMTDPMKPLGLSVWQHTSLAPMVVAGGRLFVDVTQQLTSPARDEVIAMLGRSDPHIGDALQTVVDRDDWLPPRGRCRPATCATCSAGPAGRPGHRLRADRGAPCDDRRAAPRHTGTVRDAPTGLP